jgi:hypothetical protein
MTKMFKQFVSEFEKGEQEREKEEEEELEADLINATQNQTQTLIEESKRQITQLSNQFLN